MGSPLSPWLRDIHDFFTSKTKVSWGKTVATFCFIALVHISVFIGIVHISVKPIIYDLVAPLRTEIWEDVPAGWSLGLENGAIVSNQNKAVRFDGGEFFTRLDELLSSIGEPSDLKDENSPVPALFVVDPQADSLNFEDFLSYNSAIVVGLKHFYFIEGSNSLRMVPFEFDATEAVPLTEVKSFEADYNALFDKGFEFFDWGFILFYIASAFFIAIYLLLLVFSSGVAVLIWAYFTKTTLNFSSALRFSTYAAGLPFLLFALLNMLSTNSWPLMSLSILAAVSLAQWTLRK